MSNRDVFARDFNILSAIMMIFFIMTSRDALALNNSGISYQGRILDSTGAPLADAAVQFKIQIRSPDTANCLLYEEVQVVDTTLTAGAFALTLNDGSGTRTDSTGYGIDVIFANKGTFNFTSGCDLGNSYAPNPTDGRRLQVYFKSSTMADWEPMPAQSLNFIPQSIESQQVGGYKPGDLLRVDKTSVQTVAPFSYADYTNLVSLLSGSSTQYVATSTTHGAALPSYSSNPSSPSSGSLWYDTTLHQVKFYDGTSVQTFGTASGVSSGVSLVQTGTGLTGGSITASGTISIASGGVDTPQLASYSVTAAKIASGTITGDKLDTGISINTSGTLTASQISASSMSARALMLYDPDAPGTGKISLAAPISLTSDYSLALPASSPTAGQVLVSDASGALSWTALAGSATTGFSFGSSALPGISFASEPATGVYRPSAGVLGLAAGGVDGLRLNYASSAVNYAALTPSASSGNVVYGVAGADTNINLQISPKGSGNTIFTGGNIGIGTASPNFLLDISSSANSNVGLSVVNTSGGTSAVATMSLGTDQATNRGTVSFYGASYPSSSIVGPSIFEMLSVAPTSSGGALQLRVKNALPIRFFTSNTERMRIDGSGNIGIGTTDPGAKFHLPAGVATASGAPLKFTAGTNLTTPEPGAVEYDGNNLYFTNASGTRQAVVTGVIASSPWSVSSPNIYYTSGYVGVGTSAPSHLLSVGSVGSGFDTYQSGTTAGDSVKLVSNNAGAAFAVQNQNASGYSGIEYLDTSGSTQVFTGFNNNNAQEFRFNNIASGGYINFMTGGAARLHVANSGNIGIGTTAPGAKLHLPAGTATASTSPLKFTAGTNLTTPEPGAVEYDGNNLYFTNASGTRQALASATSVASSYLPLSGGTMTGTITAASGTVSAPSLAFTTDATTGLFAPSSGTLAMTATGSERVRFASNGNVGIGTTDPVYPLSVQGDIYSSTGVLRSGNSSIYEFKSSGSFKLDASAGGGGELAYRYGSGGGWYHSFYTGQSSTSPVLKVRDYGIDVTSPGAIGDALTVTANSNSIFKMTNAGLVGIGTSAPSALLHLGAGIAAASGAPLKFTAGTNLTAPEVGAMEFDGNHLYFTNASGTRQTLATGTVSPDLWSTSSSNIYYASGYVGIGTTNPTKRLHLVGTGGYNDGIYIKATGSGAGDYASFTGENDSGDLGQLFLTSSAYSTVAKIGPRAIGFYNNGTGGISMIADNSSSNIRFVTGGLTAEAMRIDSNGRIGIGTTAPTAKLHLPAGTATASTAPLKFTAGTNLTTPEAGAVEYDGNNLYFTNASGTRQALASATSVANSYLPLSGGTMTGTMTAASGAAATPSIAFTTDATTGLYAPSSGALAVTATGSERVRFASNGNVGIGTTAPIGKLHIVDSVGSAATADNIFKLETTAGTIGPSFQFKSAEGANFLMTATGSGNTGGAGAFRIMDLTAGVNRIFITSTGNLGFGADTPKSKVDINGGLSLGSYAGVSAAPSNGLIVSGNVGFGNISPTARLQIGAGVATASGAPLKFTAGTNLTAPEPGAVEYDGNYLYYTDASSVRRTLVTTTGGASGFNAGSASMPGWSVIGNSNTGLFSPASNAVAFSVGGSEALRVASGGNVGIGTTSPVAKLQVGSGITTPSTQLALGSQGTNYDSIGAINNNEMFIQPYSYMHILRGYAYTTGNQKMTSSDTAILMDDTNINLAVDKGKVGIGTTSPSTLLHAKATAIEVEAKVDTTGGYKSMFGMANAGVDYGQLYFDNSTNNVILTQKYTSGYIGFGTNSRTADMIVAASGAVGIGTTTPSAKLDVAGPIVSEEIVIPTGASIDFATGNSQVLQSPGTPSIYVANMVAGGVYNVVIEDTTSRTYTFNGCTTTYWSPSQGATTNRSVFTIYRRGSSACYITWTTGFN